MIMLVLNVCGSYVVNQVLVHAERCLKKFICLRDSIIDSDFAELNDTNPSECPSMHFCKISV